MNEKQIAYKGFDADLKCRGFQFEVGATYRHAGEVKVCLSGFHSCVNPWDVLYYYDITSRFAVVEASGDTVSHNSDSKIASAEVTIKEELKLPDFITTCINYIKDAVKSDIDPASGYSSKLAASGVNSKLAASGYSSNLAASGYSSKLAASGDSSNLAASGNSSNLATSGYSSNLAASGDSSNLAASGYSSKLAASGYSSNLAASGNSSNLAASGDSSNLAASGYSSKLAASGVNSIAIAAGVNSMVKGGENCALALTRWIESEKRYRITVAYVGENGIKADAWYMLNDSGEFIECKC